MKNYLLYLILFIISILQGCKEKLQVDLIVHDAHIYTADSTFSKAQAFAIKDGKFVMIGTDKEVLKRCETTDPVQIVDAKQRSIYPGFYDSHGHIFQLGQLTLQADLVDSKSFREVLIRLKRYRRKHKNKTWILGRGWNENDWEQKTTPTKIALDTVYADIPVLLERMDGHAALVNSKALEIAGITPKTKIDGGFIEVKNGKLTGILSDKAVEYVKSFIPKITPEECRKMILKAQEICIAQGITSLGDAGLNKEEVALLDSMQQVGELKLRIYGMLSPTPENQAYFLEKGVYKTDRLHIRSFSLSADGALGPRGGLLLNPYTDKNTYGLQKFPTDSLRTLLKTFYDKGFQVNTDCVGDSATRMMLNLYAEVLPQDNDNRWRLEHLQVVNADDMNLFKEYKVLPSVQPLHCTEDMPWLSDRLGKSRLNQSYPYQDLMQQNGLIAFGSDFPAEEPSPIYAFHAAMSRQNSMHEPDSGFFAQQIIDKQDALRALTIWAAYAHFEENERGSIEIGKDADFVILDTDIMDTDRRLLRLSMVLNTYIAGEKIYSNYESGY